jgi:orotidine-5'-phosphate decarboxylase
MDPQRPRAPQDYIVFPLDVPSAAEARSLVAALDGAVGMFKNGLELFVREGPSVVAKAGIFLDLKLHDIPATVERAMGAAAAMGVDCVTVHCGEAAPMLAAAVRGAGGRVAVLGVTVLTSVGSEDLQQAGFTPELARDPVRLVLARAAMAEAAGCAGVVCSGQELDALKGRFGRRLLTMVPGIRPAGPAAGNDDQRRVATPAQAIARGADYLVIGRPIRAAADPRRAAEAIARQIAQAL